MKGLLFLLCAVAGGVAGGYAVHALKADPAPVRGEAPRGPDLAPLARDIEDLRRRVDAVEAQAARAPAPVPDAPARPLSAGGRPAEARPAADAEGGTARTVLTVDQVLERFRGRRFGHDESNRLFGWLTANKERIGDVVAALVKEIERNPDDADLRVQLATAHVADLVNNTVPGPQQGAVWAKAEAAYDAALEIEPEHWQARFGKAFGTSMAPEFIGLRPEAIKQFEGLKTQQESMAPEPHFAETYFRLGTLYKDAGNSEKARQIWDAGLKLFPDNEVLKGTLEASTKK